MYRRHGRYGRNILVLGAVSLSLLSSTPKALSRPQGGAPAPQAHTAAPPPQIHPVSMPAPHAMAPAVQPHFAPAMMPQAMPIPVAHPMPMPVARPMPVVRPMTMPAMHPMPVPHPMPPMRSMPAIHPMPTSHPMPAVHYMPSMHQTPAPHPMAMPMPSAHPMSMVRSMQMPANHSMQMPHHTQTPMTHINPPRMQTPSPMPHGMPIGATRVLPASHQIAQHTSGITQQRLARTQPHEAQIERAGTINRQRSLAMAGGLAGAAAVTGLAAHGFMNHGQTTPQLEPLHGGIAHQAGNFGQGRLQNRTAVPAPSLFANPRPVNEVRPGISSYRSQRAGQPLSWAHASPNIPRPGNRILGREGAIDPGGYLRAASSPSPNITPGFARQQFASVMPNYQAIANYNNRHLVADRANWPWQLPPYASGWFNGYNRNPWSWPQPNLGWTNGFGMFGGLSNFWPWGINNNLPWVPDLNYYNGYYWNNQNYACDYFASNGFCPTPYVFNVGLGQFWQPGVGYFDSLPYGYEAPITVAVQEIVPEYDQYGQIIGYQRQNFYYNAFWDSNAQCYGYYDYRQQFHWLTFPWLNSWNGQP